jgi:hypothetical protein
MDNRDIKVGDILDLSINNPSVTKTYIVGEVTGIRQGYVNKDKILVMLDGLDWWIALDDNVEVRFADR